MLALVESNWVAMFMEMWLDVCILEISQKKARKRGNNDTDTMHSNKALVELYPVEPWDSACNSVESISENNADHNLEEGKGSHDDVTWRVPWGIPCEDRKNQ